MSLDVAPAPSIVAATVCPALYAINAVVWFAFYQTYPRDMERLQRELAAEQAPRAKPHCILSKA